MSGWLLLIGDSDSELRYHGEFGVEAQFCRDGELVIGRRFDTKALAVQWTEQERGAIGGRK